jgi:hypothetical protein
MDRGVDMGASVLVSGEIVGRLIETFSRPIAENFFKARFFRGRSIDSSPIERVGKVDDSFRGKVELGMGTPENHHGEKKEKY